MNKHCCVHLAMSAAGLGLVLMLALGGCGRKDAGSEATTAGAGASSSASGGASGAFAGLDAGARAAESGAPDAALASQGEKLFQTRGCSGCHAFGRRVTGPDLSGVTQRRTAAWIQSQILHPVEMVKSDSTAHSLYATYAVQMPNLALKPEEAKSVLEFFKLQDQKKAVR